MFYGLFGCVTMLWIYVKYGVEFLIRFFKGFDVLRLGAFVSLGLTVAYLTMAGHVLFTVTSGFFFAFALVYARLLTTEKDKL